MEEDIIWMGKHGFTLLASIVLGPECIDSEHPNYLVQCFTIISLQFASVEQEFQDAFGFGVGSWGKSPAFGMCFK